jgi:threonyl-tRNA synthetase
LEFVLRDAIGRDWQCGTLQVDMNLPERFDLTYVAEDGSRQRPVMLHRALFGSLERFTGILLEHYTGKLPAWLAPVQAVVLSITEQHAGYAQKIQQFLNQLDIRTELDGRNEKIGYKIREHSLQRIPYLIVVGGDEMAHGTAALRTQSGEDLGKFPVEQLAGYLKNVTRMPIAEPITQWGGAQENCA